MSLSKRDWPEVPSQSLLHHKRTIYKLLKMMAAMKIALMLAFVVLAFLMSADARRLLDYDDCNRGMSTGFPVSRTLHTVQASCLGHVHGQLGSAAGRPTEESRRCIHKWAYAIVMKPIGIARVRQCGDTSIYRQRVVISR